MVWEFWVECLGSGVGEDGVGAFMGSGFWPGLGFTAHHKSEPFRG